jgi:hypothetical protein
MIKRGLEIHQSRNPNIDPNIGITCFGKYDWRNSIMAIKFVRIDRLGQIRLNAI